MHTAIGRTGSPRPLVDINPPTAACPAVNAAMTTGPTMATGEIPAETGAHTTAVATTATVAATVDTTATVAVTVAIPVEADTMVVVEEDTMVVVVEEDTMTRCTEALVLPSIHSRPCRVETIIHRTIWVTTRPSLTRSVVTLPGSRQMIHTVHPRSER